MRNSMVVPVLHDKAKKCDFSTIFCKNGQNILKNGQKIHFLGYFLGFSLFQRVPKLNLRHFENEKIIKIAKKNRFLAIFQKIFWPFLQKMVEKSHFFTFSCKTGNTIEFLMKFYVEMYL